ncbi:MAG: hypothetical protein IJT23_06960 [Clostridia bacterium]|nr:hypothetical protein [Clostridia bacterium]
MAIIPSWVVATAVACCGSAGVANQNGSIDCTNIFNLLNQKTQSCRQLDVNSLCDILEQMGIHIDNICDTDTCNQKEEQNNTEVTVTPQTTQKPQATPKPQVTATPQVTVTPQVTQKPIVTPTPQAQTASEEDKYALEVVDLVNKERAKYGLGNLQVDTTLMRASYARAKEIKTSFSHTRPNGTSCFTVLKEYGINYRSAGENIAYGQRTPQAVVTAWMNSEGHRANILNGNFTKIGVGCYKSGSTYYWSQEFIS